MKAQVKRRTSRGVLKAGVAGNTGVGLRGD
jgi:hypothetical protein